VLILRAVESFQGLLRMSSKNFLWCEGRRILSSKGKIQMDVGPMGVALGGWGHAILSLLRVVLRHSETVSSPSSCGVTNRFFANVK